MCDPVTAAAAGLQGVQTVASIGSQNAYAEANARNAKQAGTDEAEQVTARFIEDSRSLVQGGFDAVLEGRANEATAYTSALENGVQGASVKAVLRDQRRTASRNVGRTKSEMTSLEDSVSANLKHIGTKTQNRINSTPKTSLGLGDVAGILAPIARSQME